MYPSALTLPHVGLSPVIGPLYPLLNPLGPLGPLTRSRTHCTKQARPRGTQTWCNRSAPCFAISCLALQHCRQDCHVRVPAYPDRCVATASFTVQFLAKVQHVVYQISPPTYIRWLAECLCRHLPCLQCIDQLVLAGTISCDQLRTAAPACSRACSQPLYNTWVGRCGPSAVPPSVTQVLQIYRPDF